MAEYNHLCRCLCRTPTHTRLQSEVSVLHRFYHIPMTLFLLFIISTILHHFDGEEERTREKVSKVFTWYTADTIDFRFFLMYHLHILKYLKPKSRNTTIIWGQPCIYIPFLCMKIKRTHQIFYLHNLAIEKCNSTSKKHKGFNENVIIQDWKKHENGN